MPFAQIQNILPHFNIGQQNLDVEVINQGLINTTCKVTTAEGDYILQRVNHSVFKNPNDIEFNINLIVSYLQKFANDYYFVAPIHISKEKHLLQTDKPNEYYRVFPFVKNSHAKAEVGNAEQAYQAAKQFGKFTKVLSGLPVNDLKTTIPDFHNLSLRYQQFTTAIKNGNAKRIAQAKELIDNLLAFDTIIDTYEAIKINPAFKKRVTHHDTKISNVLFDSNDQGICVIDLDTVMPGYFISDLGDMMRTYLSPVNEESTSWEEVEVRADVYEAIVAGYMEEMKDELSDDEKAHVYYSGCFMIYMQALRFLTDYLNDDVYYGKKYEEHNYNRALNQYYLLKSLELKKEILQQLQFVM